ncbi:MAG: hypothetical protein H0U98_05235 [Alphaproteobacteria bacterium]|nr:hypothetical protein [Alphaproteobacteria bacterium]
MKRGIAITLLGATMLLAAPFASLAQAPAPPTEPGPQTPPMVAPAKPGVFTATKKGPTGYHLVVTGHSFTSRDAIEHYLAYRAATLTQEQKNSWFTLTETHAKGDTVPASKPDPAGLRYSFRMAYWRPMWRTKSAGSPAWKSWSPFSGAAFPDAKSISDYEVSADIVMHKGNMNDADPLAFEAGAVDDWLVNQVSPPT